MILDSISSAEIYFGISPKIQKALEFIAETDFESQADGRIDIDGDNIYALVQRYTTKDAEEAKWESHQKYIDIHYMEKGFETVGYTNYEYLDLEVPYDAEKDCMLYDGEGDFFQLGEGDFAIFFPQDAHMPGIMIDDEGEEVLKIVVKIKI